MMAGGGSGWKLNPVMKSDERRNVGYADFAGMLALSSLEALR
jgi:hypothetical protein